MVDLLTTTDQMGREVAYSYPPKRIISLVPSQTEFLIDLGVSVIGRTKFCIHPQPSVKEVPVIGGTKDYRFDQIDQLRPDLIIGNKEENDRKGIEALSDRYPVWMSDIYTLSDAFQMMKEVAQLCDRSKPAEKLIAECKSSLDRVEGTASGKVVYLIWQKPWMAAGRNTFVDHMLIHLGYENVVTQERYPELTVEEISQLAPEKILLSSEPYPFKSKHEQLVQDIWPSTEVQLVDGELFSWYGSRLRKWTN